MSWDSMNKILYMPSSKKLLFQFISFDHPTSYDSNAASVNRMNVEELLIELLCKARHLTNSPNFPLRYYYDDDCLPHCYSSAWRISLVGLSLSLLIHLENCYTKDAVRIKSRAIGREQWHNRWILEFQSHFWIIFTCDPIQSENNASV